MDMLRIEFDGSAQLHLGRLAERRPLLVGVDQRDVELKACRIGCREGRQSCILEVAKATVPLLGSKVLSSSNDLGQGPVTDDTVVEATNADNIDPDHSP